MHARTLAVSVAVGSAATGAALMAAMVPASAGVSSVSAHRYVTEVCGTSTDVPALSYSNGSWYRYTCHHALYPWEKVR